MINVCPFCGKFLELSVSNGITSCSNCNRVFDDSPKNRMAAAAWICKKNHIPFAECIAEQYDLSHEQSNMIQQYVIDEGYSPADLYKMAS